MTSSVDAEVTEDFATAVRRVLDADAIHTVLAGDVLVDVDPAIAERVTARVESLRLGLIGQVDTILMEDDLRQTISLSYVELKAQWIQRQVRVCYEEMMTGSCNREIALEASAISCLLAQLEPVLDEEELQKIQEIFASMTAD